MLVVVLRDVGRSRTVLGSEGPSGAVMAREIAHLNYEDTAQAEEVVLL